MKILDLHHHSLMYLMFLAVRKILFGDRDTRYIPTYVDHNAKAILFIFCLILMTFD
jgi:hypothetical protein